MAKSKPKFQVGQVVRVQDPTGGHFFDKVLRVFVFPKGEAMYDLKDWMFGSDGPSHWPERCLHRLTPKELGPS